MLNSVVVSIDYRLSPETVFPGQLNDCENVLEYFIENAKEKYNVDTNKVRGNNWSYPTNYLLLWMKCTFLGNTVFFVCKALLQSYKNDLQIALYIIIFFANPCRTVKILFLVARLASFSDQQCLLLLAKISIFR